MLLGGGAGGVALVSVVALPLAFSSPFPTPKEGGEWIIDNPPFNARLAALAVETPRAEPQTDGRVIMAALDDSADQPLTFAERWNFRVPQAAITGPAADEDPPADAPDAEPPDARSPDAKPSDVKPSDAKPSDAARRAPAEPASGHNAHAPARTAAAPKRAAPVDPVEQYLWDVYLRKPVKSDSTGDFTWKDQAAAKRLGMTLRAYVVGGMDPDFREQLYHAGHAMDASGLRWSMLSAFRDDYRQSLAAGFKARGGNSQHGGSRATGGYGHGRAVDITGGEGDSEAIWRWIDVHGAKYGLSRPMTRIDPAHIQARGSFHDLAHDMREARHKLEAKLNGATAAAPGNTKVAAHVEK
jgi:hypothetical protein